MHFRSSLLLWITLAIHPAKGQELVTIAHDSHVSLRGLAVVDDSVLWASGDHGTVGWSADGGGHWRWMQIKGFERNDFRSVEAFSAKEAIIMAITQPAAILKTIDGGLHWKTTYLDSSKNAFFDAMDFHNKNEGVVIGDPINGKPLLAITRDGGVHWNPLDHSQKLTTLAKGEAFFAASGTNIKILQTSPAIWTLFFISGGTKSRLFRIGPSAKIDSLPLLQGNESSGAFSMDLVNDREGIIVGGDYRQDQLHSGNCVLFHLNSAHPFILPQVPPHGYRSCVAYMSASRIVCCGSSGVDVSSDGGRTWQLISSASYNVCKKAKRGQAVFLAGPNGAIARLKW